jgi:hypothetical protein
MNNAMAKLAEALNIDHAKMPREQMAEAVCEKALLEISQLNEKLSATKDYLRHQMKNIKTMVDDDHTPHELLAKAHAIKSAANLVLKYAEEAQSDTGKVYVIDADWIDGLSEIIDKPAIETNGMAI